MKPNEVNKLYKAYRKAIDSGIRAALTDMPALPEPEDDADEYVQLEHRVHTYVRAQFTLSLAELSDGPLEQESRDGLAMNYLGVWQEREYQPGDTVSDRSALWVCRSVTTSRPPGDAWQMAVKPPARPKDLEHRG